MLDSLRRSIKAWLDIWVVMCRHHKRKKTVLDSFEKKYKTEHAQTVDIWFTGAECSKTDHWASSKVGGKRVHWGCLRKDQVQSALQGGQGLVQGQASLYGLVQPCQAALHTCK